MLIPTVPSTAADDSPIEPEQTPALSPAIASKEDCDDREGVGFGARIDKGQAAEICPVIAEPHRPLPATPPSEAIRMSDDLDDDDDDDFEEGDEDELEDDELPVEREDDGLGTDEEDDLDEFDDFDEEDFDDDFDDDFEEEFEDDYEIEIEEDLSQMGIKTEDDDDEDLDSEDDI